jgi:hypothetical protein
VRRTCRCRWRRFVAPVIVRSLLGLVGVAVMGLVSACGLIGDRRGEAESIERQIAAMPGVVATDLGYIWSLGERRTFLLDVRLSLAVTDDQAVAVGKAVLDGIRSELGGHDARLHLLYPAIYHPNPYAPDFSQAQFWFNPSDQEFPADAYQFADSIRLWMHAARSPVTAHASLEQAWDSGSRARSVDLTLRNNVDPLQTDGLAKDIGDRADVTWRLAVVTDDTHKPHEYNSSPEPPTAIQMAMFTEINGLVGAADQLEVDTSTSFSRKHAETAVTIEIADGPDRRERTIRTAESVAAVLPRFGREVTLNVYGHESAAIVVGGCYFREGQTSGSDLEMQLSDEYETC